ncbi:hypothetical protein ALQ95_200083 [Pseudomonas syringae pv. ribicola]|uniref:Uncharacterized protein n=1 Tax=Pseudomonas syringae pv. ribicola TaxID=55398 RepID=A0A3M2VX38_PSESI|nr:hypothetical protein ALQ95_200083 [Pseudomonas syringae pv. ribicola]
MPRSLSLESPLCLQKKINNFICLRHDKGIQVQILYLSVYFFFWLLYFVTYKSITWWPSRPVQMELVSISTPLAPALSGLGIRKSA